LSTPKTKKQQLSAIMTADQWLTPRRTALDRSRPPGRPQPATRARFSDSVYYARNPINSLKTPPL